MIVAQAKPMGEKIAEAREVFLREFNREQVLARAIQDNEKPFGFVLAWFRDQGIPKSEAWDAVRALCDSLGLLKIMYVARVEEHTYDDAIDKYVHVEIFRDKTQADEWARSECERIMHDFSKERIDLDEEELSDISETCRWDERCYVSDYLSDDNDVNLYCYWFVEEKYIR